MNILDVYFKITCSFSLQMLEHYVDHLPKPVCLVAHYGLGYDFPLLQSELLKTGSQLQTDLLVLDSLQALRQMFADKAAAELVMDHLF